MKIKLFVVLTAMAIGTGVLSQAHAGGVSIGIHLPLPPLPPLPLPGFVVAPPVAYAPAPCAPTVVVRPPVAYCPPAVVAYPRPYYRPGYVYGRPVYGYGRGYGHGHGYSHGHGGYRHCD